VIPLREQDYIRQRFERELESKVKIDYFTQRASALYVPGREECVYCEDARQMLEELAALSEKLTLTVHELADEREAALKLGVDKVPGVVVRGPLNRPLRFFGIPGGNEFPNFIESLIEASKAKVTVDAEAAKHLKKLKDKVTIVVYVTPTCPHCPGVVRAAYRLALASSHIEASAVEIGEFPRLAERLGVRAVPFIVFGDRAAIAGALDEAGLAEQALKVAEGGVLGSATAPGGASSSMGATGPSPASGLVLPR
jgi:glutaredoxin-like protein